MQKKDGLHAANKITDKHVYFENHKMRVSLASQTLSRSVSVALRTMRDLGYSQFKDCEATAQFIEVIQLVIIDPSTYFYIYFFIIHRSGKPVKFAVVQSIPMERKSSKY